MQVQFDAQTPRQVLDEIKEMRQWLKQKKEKLPENPVREILQHLDRREGSLYHDLLRNDLLQVAADTTPWDNQRYGDLIRTAMGPASSEQAAALEQTRLIASDPACRAEFNTRYFEQLRSQLSDQVAQERLDRPIGKGWAKDREMTEGMSIKNWRIVGLSIWEVYQALLPLYPSTPRLSKSKYSGPKVKLAEYPKELLKDIVELFTTEFPEDLNDLTVDDVKSRIQYKLNKLREEKSEYDLQRAPRTQDQKPGCL